MHWRNLTRLGGARLVLPLLALALLSGCVSHDAAGEQARAGAEGAGSGQSQAEEVPEHFRGTAGITEQRPDIETPVTLERIRAGRHETHDRLVFEFREALPGYHIEYIDKPVRQCGSGRPVSLAGQGWLLIRFEPARAHDEQGRSTIPGRQLQPELPTVLALKATCDFEGVLTWVAGVSAPNRYRALELQNPPRLVIDIRH